MATRVGTSGFSYKEWCGSFYPAKLATKEMLAYYAQRLTTVELNNTFYRMPTGEQLASWSGAVEPNFRFVVKAPRRISHLSRLKDVEDPVQHLQKMLQGLEPHLGAVLVQLPPNFKLNLERLDGFLRLWGPKLPLALEFRHESWYVPEVASRLAEADAALVQGDHLPAAESGFHGLSKRLGFFRLRSDNYTDTKVESWVSSIRQCTAAETYVFLKHEVAAPSLAMRLQQMVNSA